MTTKGKKGPSNQAAKFRELARQAECDEDEDHFDDTLKRVAKAPAPKGSKPSPKKSED